MRLGPRLRRAVTDAHENVEDAVIDMLSMLLGSLIRGHLRMAGIAPVEQVVIALSCG